MQCFNKHKSALSVDLIQEVWCSCCMSPEKFTTYFHFKQQSMVFKHKNGGASVTLYVFSNITEQSREDMSWTWTHTLMHSDYKDAENWIRPFSPCLSLWTQVFYNLRSLWSQYQTAGTLRQMHILLACKVWTSSDWACLWSCFIW